MVALALSSVGLYGVMSFGVSQRRREIGIRMALGAARGDVIRQFVGQGMVLTIVGVVVGLVAALGASRWIASQLYDVAPHDPSTYVVMAVVLVAIAMAATFIPARRATRVNPIEALRHE